MMYLNMELKFFFLSNLGHFNISQKLLPYEYITNKTYSKVNKAGWDREVVDCGSRRSYKVNQKNSVAHPLGAKFSFDIITLLTIYLIPSSGLKSSFKKIAALATNFNLLFINTLGASVCWNVCFPFTNLKFL